MDIDGGGYGALSPAQAATPLFAVSEYLYESESAERRALRRDGDAETATREGEGTVSLSAELGAPRTSVRPEERPCDAAETRDSGGVDSEEVGVEFSEHDLDEDEIEEEDAEEEAVGEDETEREQATGKAAEKEEEKEKEAKAKRRRRATPETRPSFHFVNDLRVPSRSTSCVSCDLPTIPPLIPS